MVSYKEKDFMKQLEEKVISFEDRKAYFKYKTEEKPKSKAW